MAPTKVVSRESIESWSADSPKLLHFRMAVEAMQAISDAAVMDERGYQWVAGVHGGFGGNPFCHHGDDHFITWHRPYLLDMELKLRAQIAKLAGQAAADEWRLPYWAWDAEDVQGLPAAFTAETYEVDGETRPNPLFSAPYELPYPVDIDPSDMTWRDPASLEELRALRPLVQAALKLSDYHDFSTAIENPHNQIHNWTGGFMVTYRSAFDPLFWVHHANVDRQFWQWQQGDGHMASIPRAVRELPCQPFNFKDIRAAAFFETRELGYTYNADRRLVPHALAAAGLAGAPSEAPLPLDFGDVSPGFKSARVNFHGVRHPVNTCELRLFANRPAAADAATPRTGDEHFLGSYALLGQGPCPGAPGHCDPDEPTGSRLRPPHHLAPFDIFIDITDPLRTLAGDASVRLEGEVIVVGSDRAQLPTSAIEFDNATLTLK